MKRQFLLFLMFLLPFILKASFGFFGSAVYLESNGSSAFYNCFGSNIGTQPFSGSLGPFVQNSGTLKLQGAEMKTWKDGNGNVCIPVFNYRIYPTGSPNGNFIAVELPFFCNCSGGSFTCGGGSCGGNDQKWQKPGSTGSGLNIDLTTYTPGTYTMEVFYRVPGNQNGTSDCPDNVWDNNGGNPTNYTMNFTVTAVMPLNFLSVEANKYGDKVLLSWSTEYENGNSHFEIQRSRDASKFEKIGIVKSSGISTKQFSYDFLDESPLIKNNIYRIKQIDLDGKYMFSPSVSVYMSSKIRIFEINPNIVGNNLMAEFGKPTESGIIQLYDLSGKISKRIILSKGIEIIHINVADLIPGLYIARYIDGEETISKKFIKQ
ncbi:MAG: T9SS type A sorting domain-containing protein [Saprospiraceae bacterium]|nr:T9SS type A sorting domain-containing protein [Saprospiraceae bacterium]